MFRQAVLVRDDSRATAGGSTRAPIAELHARSSLRPPRRLRPEARAVDEFRAPGGGSLRIDHPLVKGERWSSWPTRGRTRCGTASSPRKPQSGSPARATTRRFWPRCWSPIAATRSTHACGTRRRARGQARTPACSRCSTGGRWPRGLASASARSARVSVLAAADDHVLYAADDAEVADLVHDGELAGVPSSRPRRSAAGRLLVVPIAAQRRHRPDRRNAVARGQGLPDPGTRDAVRHAPRPETGLSTAASRRRSRSTGSRRVGRGWSGLPVDAPAGDQ